jgi:solute carrier family 8 (sodium/calcium exchanger)
VSVDFLSGQLGSQLKVTFTCTQRCVGAWYAQPKITGTPAGNILLSSAILLTGGTFEQFKDFADMLKLPIMTSRTFYSYQSSLLFPTINHVYQRQKEALLATLGDQPVLVAGDGRCDSPGFSAKYSTYNLLDMTSGAIVTFSLNQVCVEFHC